MFYFKEVLYENRVFVIYRHKKGVLGVFIENKNKKMIFNY